MTVVVDQLAPGVAPPPGGARRGARAIKRDKTTIVIIVIVSVLMVLMIGIPLGGVLSKALSREGVEILGQVVTRPSNRRIVLNTLKLGVLVGAIGTLVGFLFAYTQVRLKVPGKKLLHVIAMIPVVSPPFAVATATITLFGRNGMISNGIFGIRGDVYGLPGLVFVLCLSFFPVSYLNLRGMLEALDPALDEAAANLGATRSRVFWGVTLPMLGPGLAGSFLLLFVEAIADLANPLVLGGDYTVLASRAYLAITGEYNVAAGSAYSVVLLVPALTVFLVQRYWVARKSVVSVTGKPAGRQELITDWRLRVPIVTVVACASLLIAVVYLAVLTGGFVKILGVNNTFTLDHYRFVVSGIGLTAMRQTTAMALVAAPVAGVLGMVIAWLVVRRLRSTAGLMDFVGMLGLAVPGTVIGIGYAIAYNTPTTAFGVQLFPAVAGGAAFLGGAAAITMVYVVVSIPAGLRSGVAAMQQIDPAIEEASVSLGAGGAVTFRTVTLPLIRSALLSGLVFSFAKCMTLVSAIIFITTPRTQLMTIQILSEVDAGRFGNAFAYSTLLILIVLGVVGLMTLALQSVFFRRSRHTQRKERS